MRSTRIPRKAASVAAAALVFGAAGPATASVIPGEPSSAVHPNPDQQVTAQPSPRSPVSCGDVCSGGGYRTAAPPPLAITSELRGGARLNHQGRPRPLVLSSTSNTAGTPRTVVRVVTNDGGFDWGDAGIGAGGLLALTLIGFGGGLTILRRRGRAPRTPAGVAG